jgi:ATP-dependent exoDNAse (exonuclease V) alpha subunit
MRRSPKEIPVVLVQMENDLGFSLIPSMPNVISFTEQCDKAERYERNYHRWQLPLTPSFAITTHKMQGSTAKGNCVTLPSDNKPFTRGLDYVANSRAKELSKLFLIRPLQPSMFSSHPQERNAIEKEYARLSEKFTSEYK